MSKKVLGKSIPEIIKKGDINGVNKLINCNGELSEILDRFMTYLLKTPFTYSQRKSLISDFIINNI